MDSTVPGPDWRVVDGVATAWFDALSLIEGAALVGRIATLSAEVLVDLRPLASRGTGDQRHFTV